MSDVLSLEQMTEADSWSEVCRQIYGNRLTILSMKDGWKAIGTLYDPVRQQDFSRIEVAHALRAAAPADSPEQACEFLLERDGHLRPYHDGMWVRVHRQGGRA